MWLESQFRKDNNNSNYSDFMGYEIKKHASKISFGDWSANEYIFRPKDVLSSFNENIKLNRSEFLKLFGRYNHEKKRYSWSGSVCPSTYNEWTKSGQILLFNSTFDLFVYYMLIQRMLFLMKNMMDMFCKMMCKFRCHCITYLYYLIFLGST